MIVKECRYCMQSFEGYTEKQVNHILLMHIISKHEDKIHLDEGWNKVAYHGMGMLEAKEGFQPGINVHNAEGLIRWIGQRIHMKDYARR